MGVIVVFGLLGYWASRISFEEDISKLIPSAEDSQQINKVLQNTNFADKIIVNVSTSDSIHPGELQNYADELDSLLQKDSAYIGKLQSKFEDDQMFDLLDFVSAHLPLYLEDSDYTKIDSLLQPDLIKQKVGDSYHSIVSPSGMITTEMIRSDPFGISFLALNKFRRLQSGDNFSLKDGYLIHENGKNLFVFVSPKAKANETSQNAFLVESLNSNINFLNSKYKNVKAEYFGATPVSVANAKQIKNDIILTLSISLVLLFALFIYFYRKFSIPFIILIPAIFGSLLGIVILYLIKGTISAISIGIGSVLLGLTLDYSLHILSHYRSTGDIKKLFQSTTKPLIVCAVFTAADFLCLLFLHSDVLKDLGVFAAVSVLGAAFFALIFVPQVYSPKNSIEFKQNTIIDKLSRYDFSKNKWFLGISVLLILISLFTYKNVGFENDLNKLNFFPKDLKTAENNLDKLNNYSSKSIYIAAYGKDYEAASKANSELFENLKNLESNKEILTFNSIGGIALSEEKQIEKIKQWDEFWTPEKIESLQNQMISEGKKFGFKENTFQPFFAKLNETYSSENLSQNELLKNLFLDEFVSNEKDFTTITSIIKTENPNTEKLINELSAKNENVLVIDRKHLSETFLSNLEADFNKLFFISSIVIFVILMLFFRSLELTLITNIPIFVGWLVTLGMMGLFGLNFNAFNIIITTLIFGLGVDYSIFVTRGLIEKYTYGTDEMAAFRSGILMSALATILCFGVLVFAKHPAIYSISWIPIIGLCVVVLMSFTIQPWLFNFFIQKPQEKGNTPRTIFNIIMTFGTFGYFFVAGFLLNILAQILLPIAPVSKKKKFKFFHKTVHLYFKTLIHGTPFVKIKIIGKENLNFDRPRIIIANHTSQLDTPTLGMIHPKSIFMVNNRVLNSKFFGKAIQMAGFYSVSDNYEEGLDGLREKIRQGYSIIIFPEGTRSRTSAIQRFHKGAFFLANELNLEILPVLVCGNADLLPKNDNVLKSGKLTIEYLPLIKPDDENFGKTHSERTKKISTYFKEKFIELKRVDEDENYFKNKLRFNYLYKPRYIQKEFNAEFNLNKKTYHKLLNLIPVKGKILHLGCGYGVLDFLLVYDSARRSVVAWDADAEKITIAQNTFTVNRFPVVFTENLPEELNNFEFVILQNSDELTRFENLVNLEDWQNIFEENELRIFRKKNAGRI
ncbi:trifunctional MMPL family transporter/lysophospholipid acyltransferase/class I SAM-dependent methyltransferase [Moheibacter sediminis]|uniref:1-acyl-sn-glycerol-3-phosphate acyltransferases n=1 Tax=Moheibacter sediminis TaxID=1434700 RepID=A0A1W1Y6A6_9FLAO|nr:trifunctional MMPL family transporter/lysophospholipid acyltransferase/class I SAM-dependent methyltransferase [Moheibacter sediminis]SMC31669.1 1-acyl-sn-glycerol-3-phosphate acyltransferases [Moheibacter sediminis]